MKCNSCCFNDTCNIDDIKTWPYAFLVIKDAVSWTRLASSVIEEMNSLIVSIVYYLGDNHFYKNDEISIYIWGNNYYDGDVKQISSYEMKLGDIKIYVSHKMKCLNDLNNVFGLLNNSDYNLSLEKVMNYLRELGDCAINKKEELIRLENERKMLRENRNYEILSKFSNEKVFNDKILYDLIEWM